MLSAMMSLSVMLTMKWHQKKAQHLCFFFFFSLQAYFSDVSRSRRGLLERDGYTYRQALRLVLYRTSLALPPTKRSQSPSCSESEQLCILRRLPLRWRQTDTYFISGTSLESFGKCYCDFMSVWELCYTYPLILSSQDRHNKEYTL